MPKELIAPDELEDVAAYETARQIDQLLSGLVVSGSSLSMTRKVAEAFSRPKPGDHLVKPRGFYTHHGVYVGDGRVIHYSGLAEGLSSGPVEEVSLNVFRGEGSKVRIKPHPHATYSREEVVANARGRLNESNYNVLFNNCEHFVNWCIYGRNSSDQVRNGFKALVSTAPLPPQVRVSASVLESADYLLGYFKGEIKAEKMLESVGKTAVSGTSVLYYSAFAQAAIPVPVVGALLGAVMGYYVGGLLNESAHIALGESEAVRVARKRRERIEQACERLVTEQQRRRVALEGALERHFGERKEVLLNAVERLDGSFRSWDVDEFAASMSELAGQFGVEIPYASFDDFDEAMNRKGPLSL